MQAWHRLTGILSSHLLRVAHNLVSDLVEVVEFLSRQMQELPPLVRVVLVQLHLGHGILGLGLAIWLGRRGAVNQLKDLALAAAGSDPSLLTSGRRVTIPVPRGRKSRPTMFYRQPQVR